MLLTVTRKRTPIAAQAGQAPAPAVSLNYRYMHTVYQSV